MENYFYKELNEKTVEAVKRDAAFFMKPGDSRLPFISDSLSGKPITGANYFNLQLDNDLNGTLRTEYVKTNEVLSSKPDWLSTLPPEKRPRGTLFQEESASLNPRYSFVMSAAELNQDVYRDNRNRRENHYIPFQTSNAPMNNFDDFVREQFTNALNASLSGCTFRNAVPEQELDQFKTKLINEITKNPEFMAGMANRAYQDVAEFHYCPFDKKQFVEKARDENSHEFKQLHSVITDHVEDMYRNRKPSFNREFNELSKPLIITIVNLRIDNLGDLDRRTAIGRETAQFIRENIRQDRPAVILADTFAGTFAEKAQKLARIGKKVFTGLMLAAALVSPTLARVDKDIAGSVLSTIMAQYKIPEIHQGRNKIDINKHIFQGGEINNNRGHRTHSAKMSRR
ncbi:MAG: hypothetical protein LBH20_05785 [Treponema sp.]|jgi:hypothetical protein|nr:hypothetical protein [Treponema sp.]